MMHLLGNLIGIACLAYLTWSLYAARKQLGVARGKTAAALWALDRRDRQASSLERREQMLLNDLDFACTEAVTLRQRLNAVEARELPQLAEIRSRAS